MINHRAVDCLLTFCLTHRSNQDQMRSLAVRLHFITFVADLGPGGQRSREYRGNSAPCIPKAEAVSLRQVAPGNRGPADGVYAEERFESWHRATEACYGDQAVSDREGLNAAASDFGP